MKNILLSFCALISSQYLFSQTVVSSCTAPDSIVQRYMNDADRLALKRIYQLNNTYTSSVIIPQAYTDTLLRALIAVYNATALPARNAVVNNYNIHTFPYPVMNRLNLAGDSVQPWMQQLKLNNIPTGNTQIDNLISTYSLTIQNYNHLSNFYSYHVVTLKSDSNYNVIPLTDLFSNIPTVAFSETVGIIGDGGNIVASIFPTYIDLTYSIGWGDCPAGCINRHYWTFRVDYNCGVQFMGESGSAIAVNPAPTIVIAGSKCINDTVTVTLTGANSCLLNNQNVSSTQFTLSSQSAATFTVLASNYGTYPVLTSTASASISIINCASSITAIAEIKKPSKYAVYPNPANEYFEVTMNHAVSVKNANSFSIYNSLGQLVLKEEISFTDNRSKRIKTSELAEGAYFIIIGNSRNESQTEKLIIAR